MNERVADKIEEIEGFLYNLGEFVPNSFEDYLESLVSRAACERMFEKIIMGLVDLTFLVIREKNINPPEDDVSAFFVLAEKNIISNELAQRMKEAKGMRNIVAHEYGRIDDEIVFGVISEEIQKDAREFLDAVRRFG